MASGGHISVPCDFSTSATRASSRSPRQGLEQKVLQQRDQRPAPRLQVRLSRSSRSTRSHTRLEGCAHEAEALIAAIHQDWGEAQGNYDEFRFFTGLRPSEQIALVVEDFDAARGTLYVTKACVDG